MRNSSSAVLTALMLLSSLAARAQSADIKTLEDIETRFCKDIASMNVDAIMSLYHQGPSLHVYDMMKPREFKKFHGKWLIVHEHGSFPIDWKTGKGDLLSTD